MDRIIMHVDMDAFFAAVEMIDDPSLKGRPVIVGGTTERGVVATCSYEARAYGVRSAMPIYMAKAKCPNGIFMPTRYWRYKEVSNKIFNILYEITNYVEPLSIDEAYLDLTGIEKDPLDIGIYIKNKIRNDTGLNISVGISYNKFLAKLASDWNKPNGLKIITKDVIPKVLFPLTIDKVYGLGKKSTKKLNDIGVFKIEDLYRLPQNLLIEFFGKYGVEIYERIRGIDNRVVKIDRERKSIGKETTLGIDTDEKNELKLYLKEFAQAIGNIMTSNDVIGKCLTVKIKTSSFVNHTKSRTLNHYTNKKEDIYYQACSILDELEFVEKIRLIGLSVSALKVKSTEQLTMF